VGIQLIPSKPRFFAHLSLYYRVSHGQFPEVCDSVEGDVISIMLVMRPSRFIIEGRTRYGDEVIGFELPVQILKTVQVNIRVIEYN